MQSSSCLRQAHRSAGGLLLLVWVLSFVFFVSCKALPSDPRAACSKGDLDACKAACAAGATGKDGCLMAEKVRDPQQRSNMYARACEAKNALACLRAAEAIASVSLARLPEYQRLLEQACQLKNRQGCERLGDLLLGNSLNQAAHAYAKACETGPTPTKCQQQVADTGARIKSAERACHDGKAEACEQLLSELATRNHDAGYLAAQAICELRGITSYYANSRMPFRYLLKKPLRQYQGCALFLLARAASDPKGQSRFQRVPLIEPPPADRGGQVQLAQVKFNYRAGATPEPELVVQAKHQLSKQVQSRLAFAQRCYNRQLEDKPETKGTIGAHFVLDRLGEPLDIRSSSDWASSELQRCLVSAALPEKFSLAAGQDAGVMLVELTFQLTQG